MSGLGQTRSSWSRLTLVFVRFAPKATDQGTGRGERKMQEMAPPSLVMPAYVAGIRVLFPFENQRRNWPGQARP